MTCDEEQDNEEQDERPFVVGKSLVAEQDPEEDPTPGEYRSQRNGEHSETFVSDPSLGLIRVIERDEERELQLWFAPVAREFRKPRTPGAACTSRPDTR